MSAKTSSKSGRWSKGTSGNPAGRPAGSRNHATLACELLLEGEAEQLTRMLVEKAKGGDLYAARLCLERILPVRKERSIHLELRPVDSAQDLPIHFQDITLAVAEGRITPREGESVANILTSHARALELVDLDRRVAELEALGTEVKAYHSDLKNLVQSARFQKFDQPLEESPQ